VLHVSNPGNTTPLWYLLILVGNSVYYIRTSASAGCIGVMTSGGDRIRELDETLPESEFPAGVGHLKAGAGNDDQA
jgi:hypothetical protein